MQNAALEQAGREERIDMRSFERQRIELAPTVHLCPAASALERKGIHTDLGDHNRKVHRLNDMIRAILRTLHNIGDWLKQLKEVIFAQKVMKDPEDYSLDEVIAAYTDLRKKERGEWSWGAQNKGLQKDIDDMAHGVILMKQYHITTVRDLGLLLKATEKKAAGYKTVIKDKEHRIRDIDAILKAVKDMKELHPVMEACDRIFWDGKKKKYAEEHADEINRYKKAQRLLKKLNVILPINSKALKAEAEQLQADVEAVTPEVDSIHTVLTDLKFLRKMVRKVMPDALPYKNPQGQQPMEDTLETAANRRDLDSLLDASARNALRDPKHETKERQQHKKRKEETLESWTSN